MTAKGEIRSRCAQGLNLLPRHMHEGVLAYLEHGREVGGFLTSILVGDLDGAWARADTTNLAHHEEWSRFLAEHLFADCHGSVLKVAAWMKMGGLDGYPDAGKDAA